MATLTIQNISEGGLDATYSAASALGDTFQNDSAGRSFIHVKNDSAALMTVTVAPETATKDVPGFGEMNKATISVEIAASGDQFIGPFPIAAFGANPDVQYSDETSVTLAALRV